MMPSQKPNIFIQDWNKANCGMAIAWNITQTIIATKCWAYENHRWIVPLVAVYPVWIIATGDLINFFLLYSHFIAFIGLLPVWYAMVMMRTYINGQRSDMMTSECKKDDKKNIICYFLFTLQRLRRIEWIEKYFRRLWKGQFIIVWRGNAIIPNSRAWYLYDNNNEESAAK